MIAVIIDDLGLNRHRTNRVVRQPAPLTLAFLPYGYHLEDHVRNARRAGHEILVHLPMEPLDRRHDPGPAPLETGVSLAENRKRLTLKLGKLDGYVGINNHMGSRFTADRAGMETVLRVLKRRGLLFVDSRTGPRSLGLSIADKLGVPAIARDVFIDAVAKPTAVEKALRRLESIARTRGYAVAIGHPYEVTLAILSRWLPNLRARGFQPVPISALVRYRRFNAGRAVSTLRSE